MKDPFEQLLKNHLSGSLSQPPAETCPDENWIAAYLEGSQSEHFKKTFERHLLQCNRCQSEMAFLLKPGVNEAQSLPTAVRANLSPRSNLLEILFAWTRASAFRPVYAILLVSVLTGVIGYRILRDDRILQRPSMETTESAARTNSTSPKADQPPASQSVNDQQPQERQLSLKSEPSMLPRRAADRREGTRESESVGQARDLRTRETSNNRDSELKDGFAAEPPSSAPAESSRDANDRLARRDAAAAQPVPAPLQKESLPVSVAGRENSQLGAKADEASAKPKNQVMPAAPLPGTYSVVGALSEKKTEQDKVTSAEEARAASAPARKKQVLAESARQTAAFEANETTPVNRIEVGGKRFDLSEGIWRDSSILPNDAKPISVGMNSPDFEKYRNQLAPFHPVLSRPEDVLIKLHSRVYRIQKTK